MANGVIGCAGDCSTGGTGGADGGGWGSPVTFTLGGDASATPGPGGAPSVGGSAGFSVTMPRWLFDAIALALVAGLVLYVLDEV